MLDKGKAPTSRRGAHYGDREADDADRDATDADREVQGFDEVTP